MNEGPWRWRAGIEAALATGLPLSLLSLAGHQSLGLIASLGSFTALYSPQLKHAERLRALLFITPLALIISTANQAGTPLDIVGERILDSLLGAVIALTVLFVSERLRLHLSCQG